MIYFALHTVVIKLNLSCDNDTTINCNLEDFDPENVFIRQ